MIVIRLLHRNFLANRTKSKISCKQAKYLRCSIEKLPKLRVENSLQKIFKLRSC
jgi:hypothetical protein